MATLKEVLDKIQAARDLIVIDRQPGSGISHETRVRLEQADERLKEAMLLVSKIAMQSSTP